MSDEQVRQIVDAIREHTRAMVAGMLWAEAAIDTEVNVVVEEADALLAALSASSGGENDAAVAAAVESPVASVSARGNPPQTEPSKAAPAATPPLPAGIEPFISEAFVRLDKFNKDIAALDAKRALNKQREKEGGQ